MSAFLAVSRQHSAISQTQGHVSRPSWSTFRIKLASIFDLDYLGAQAIVKAVVEEAQIAGKEECDIPIAR